MFLLDPTTPTGFLVMLLRGRFDRAREADSRGASVIEWVVITALLILLAGAVFVIIQRRLTAAAENIDPGSAVP